MAIRFSAARNGSCPVLVRALNPSVPICAANDDFGRKHRSRTARAGDAVAHTANERVLTEALRHVAHHGLSAAAHARAHAAAARLAGDEHGCAWWIAICRQLDRPMADAFARRIARRV
ncbi:MAG: hypothetical protein K0R64_1089 [Novosphingobium lindaniclasticum]|jgi:hypothetical protein|uniref:hypothetical protein n=1 Tax=Novosphingobium lindaniclasticum TaxID=1329895 RepID=UPI002409861F|nr:hypothetical protein [Novosphingobium lindaniclasticum]MDF2638105.1 hypothetical protein [Novosphingobium lindaniclasticum]